MLKESDRAKFVEVATKVIRECRADQNTPFAEIVARNIFHALRRAGLVAPPELEPGWYWTRDEKGLKPRYWDGGDWFLRPDIREIPIVSFSRVSGKIEQPDEFANHST